MKKSILCLLGIIGLVGPAAAEPPAGQETPRPIDIAFCIDVSGSMSTAMNRVRSAVPLLLDKLRAERKGATVRVAVAIYGHQDQRAGLLDFTADEEKLEKALRELRADPERHEEHVGRALDFTARRFSWSKAPEVERQIILIGNETMDPAESLTPVAGSTWWRVERVVPELRKLGFLFHAIYCPTDDDARLSGYFLGAFPLNKVIKGGDDKLSVAAKDEALISINAKVSWVELAQLGGGKFGQINARPGLPLLSLLPPEQFRALLRRILREDHADVKQLAIKPFDVRL